MLHVVHDMVACEVVSNGSRKSCSRRGLGAARFALVLHWPGRWTGLDILWSSSSSVLTRFLGNTLAKKERKSEPPLDATGATSTEVDAATLRRGGMSSTAEGDERGRSCRVGEDAVPVLGRPAAGTGSGDVGGVALARRREGCGVRFASSSGSLYPDEGSDERLESAAGWRPELPARGELSHENNTVSGCSPGSRGRTPQQGACQRRGSQPCVRRCA